MDREPVIQKVHTLQALARSLNQNLVDLNEEEFAALAAVLPDLAPFFQKFHSAPGNTGELIEHSHQTHIETELRRLLGENRRQEALLDAIFAADPGGLAVVAGPDLRFAYTNPAYRYICPCLGNDPIGLPYNQVWTGEHGDGFQTQIQAVLETGRPFIVPAVERVFPNGSKRMFTLQSRRIQWDGEQAALLIFWDTTDLMLSQQQLQQLLDQTALQQEWFRTTLASIGDAVITTDVQGRVTFLNPVAEHLTGWSSSKAAGQPLKEVFNIINEQTGQTAENPVGKVLAQGTIVGLANHTALITRGGQTIPIEDSAAPIKDAQGSIQGVVMVFHDVTEERKAAKVLRESEDKYRTVADFTYDWESWTAPDGTYHYVSPSCERITGYPSAAFLADPSLLLKIAHAEDRQKLTQHLQDELADQQNVKSIEFRIVTPGGEERWVSHICQSVLDHNGAWAGRRASNRDITEQMLYEAERERLLTENQRQRSLLAAQSMLDPGGQAVVSGEDLIIRYTNPAYRALTPHPEQEPLGQPYEQIWPPDEGYTQNLLIRQALLDGQEVHLQRHPRRMADGSIRHFTYHIHPLEWEGQPAAYLVLWDTTELVQAETALLENEAALKKTNAELRQQNRLIELSYEPIFTWELEGGILTWNEGCEQLYGFRREEAIGHSNRVLLQTRHPIPLADIKTQLRVEGFWTGELRQQTKDGRHLIIECRKQLVEIEGRQLVLETSRDVTERRRA